MNATKKSTLQRLEFAADVVGGLTIRREGITPGKEISHADFAAKPPIGVFGTAINGPGQMLAVVEVANGPPPLVLLTPASSTP